MRIVGLDLRDSTAPAISMTGCRKCLVARCDLRNVDVGVALGDDTHGNRVTGCDITSTLGDGVSIIGSTIQIERVTNNVVDNCYIWDFGWGLTFPGNAGVHMLRASHCQAMHNLIHDGPRIGICMTCTSDCEVAWNVVHHMGELTKDTAIIWGDTSWDWRESKTEQRRRLAWYTGNTIHHNLLYDSGGWGTSGHHDLLSVEGGTFSWGIYLDSHGSNWNIHDNIIYDTPWGAYHVHGGENNLFENNICVNGKTMQAWMNTDPIAFGGETKGNRLTRNVFSYVPGGLVQAVSVADGRRDAFAYDDNLFWGNGERPRVFGRFGEPYGPPIKATGINTWFGWISFENWQKLGQDKNSIVADPQFVDAARRDYRLKPTSPALKLGMRPVDLSDAGVYASSDRRTWPRPELPVVRDVFDYTPSFGKQMFRDYENVPLGLSETEAPLRRDDLMTVVDTTAATGKRSLKFSDAAGRERPFLPCVTYLLPIKQGKAQVSFDLRWERNGMMEMDWRDDPSNANTGPNIATTADGWLTANGKKLLELPAGQWLHLDIVCPLGEQANGTYNLTVTLPGSAPQAFGGLACPPKFQRLECIVLMAAGDGPVVFYIDNMDFRPHADK